MFAKAGASLLGMVCLLAFAPARGESPSGCGPDPGTPSASRLASPACATAGAYPANTGSALLGRVSTPSMPAGVGTVPLPPVARELQEPQVASAPAGEAASMTSMRIARGEVYRYVSEGSVIYGNQRPQGRSDIGPVSRMRYTYLETCFACAVQPGVDFGTISLNTDAFRTEIASASRDFGVDEAVVRAVIHAESAYNPRALSRVGAQGLMQLMPDTARRFGVANVFDIGQNIRGGVQYLAWLLKRFDGNLTLAAAGYNAGEGAVDRYQGVPPYSETQRYVARVAVLAERYRSARVAH
jgi:soluble lytic murein transglycosylase-like protein